jgi:hypothetical protein
VNKTSVVFSLVILSSFLLTGCDEVIKGPLKVSSSLPFRTGKSEKLVRLEEGTYKAKVTFNPEDRIFKMKVKGAEVVCAGIKKNHTMKFTIPSDVEIPTEGGHFKVDGRDILQPFDLEGNLKVAVDRSELKNGTENCVKESLVSDDGDEPSSHSKNNGKREIVYRDRKITREYEFKFINTQIQEEPSVFTGENETSDIEYVSVGTCN